MSKYSRCLRKALPSNVLPEPNQRSVQSIDKIPPENGCVGWARPIAQKCCDLEMLRGGLVLVILRPRKRDRHCQIVGDLHIVNLKDGKMVDILDSSKI
jgi:hypothetical protein